MPGAGNKRGTEHGLLWKNSDQQREIDIQASRSNVVFVALRETGGRTRGSDKRSVSQSFQEGLGRGQGRWCRSLRSPFWETNFYRPDCKGPASTLKLQPCFTLKVRQRKCGLQSFKVSAWTEHCADWLIALQSSEHLIKRQYISVKIVHIFFPSSNTDNYGMNPSFLAY